ncbi:MAG: hypothetical protein ABIN91_01170 [Mucilaginibacter sp.]|uniref:hypothetical protein n=1 Tax=Mucilaginibacter sp. TaxID=1882438 RepID=UPI0032644BBF
MKNKPLKGFYLFLILLLLITSSNSCRKDNEFTGNSGNSFIALPTTLAQLSDNAKIQLDDINNWFLNYPDLKPAQQLLDLAQQAVINGQHVVRIPMATNSAFYFTKVDGVVKIFIYKWKDEKPGSRKFTGKVVSYSFQDNVIRELTYIGGNLTSTKNLSHVLPAKNSSGIKTTSYTVSYFWGAFICWLSGGDFVYDSTDMIDGQEIIWYTCIPSESGGSGDGGDGGSWGDYWSDFGNQGGAGIYGTNDGGGGSSWVDPDDPCNATSSTTYPSPGHSPFSPDPGPDGGSGGCPTGYVPYPVVPTTSIALIAEPQNSDIITDPESGATVTYSQLKAYFEQYPEVIDQIESQEEASLFSFPSFIVSSTAMLLPAVLKEGEIIKIQHPDWSLARVYATAMWYVSGGTVHFILDVGSLVPVVGEAAALVNGGIYFLEGDKINCALSLVSAIPVVAWVRVAGQWIKVSAKSVPVAAAAGKIASHVIASGAEMRMVKVAVSAFDYASVKALKLIKPADQTLTNLSRTLVDQYGLRIVPTEATLKNMVDDIVLHGDALGQKTEQLSDAILQREGYVKQTSQYGSNNGFDGVYIKGSPSNPTDIIINEAKSVGTKGNIKLNAANAATGLQAQMSEAWINQVINNMRNPSGQAQNIIDLGNYLNTHRQLINKTVTAVDKSTGEIVVLNLQKY